MMTWGKSVFNFTATTKRASKAAEKGLEDVVDHTAEYLKTRAEIRTPVDTGFAQNSWAKATSKSGRARKVEVFNTATTAKNPRNRGRSGVPLGQYYLYWLEYGYKPKNGAPKPPRRFFFKAKLEAARFQKAQLKELNADLQRRFNNGKIT